MTTSTSTSAHTGIAPDGGASQSSGNHEIRNDHSMKSLTDKAWRGFMPVCTILPDNTPSTNVPSMARLMPWVDRPGTINTDNTRRMSGGSDTTMESPYQSSAGTSPIDNSVVTPEHLLYSPIFDHSNHNLLSPLSKHSNNLVASSRMDLIYGKEASSYKEFIPNSKPARTFGVGIAEGASQTGKVYLPGNFPSTSHMPAYSSRTNRIENYCVNYVYTVQFKRAHRHYLLPKSAPGVFSIGTFVKVEADRGEDLGVIVEMVEMESLRSGNVRTRLQNGELKSILYHATLEEIAQLKGKTEEERAIVRIATERMIVMYGGQLKIVDADYQYDRHKLTIYYESNQRIDFREFVKDLFTIYKTRIWMEHITYSFRPNEAAAIALLTGENMDNVVGMKTSHAIATMQYGATALFPHATGGAAIGQYGIPKTPTFSAAPTNNFPGVCDSFIKSVAPVSYGILSKSVMPHTFANENFIQPRNLNEYNNFNLE